MKTLVTLAALCVLFSAAYGLHCYTCTDHTCTKLRNITCPAISDRCFTIITRWKVTSKGCGSSDLCRGPCCDTDLCNSAKHVGPSAILLLVSTAIITLVL
ncbi:hypothetical protein UPYG_G00290240 [Umbra pygmaea]|uniref:Lymphocyte antigen 6D-like n=1 Tax=Umbra pygmaea TaxID=75934 RepID=A0ABD0WKJ1_UMBPY